MFFHSTVAFTNFTSVWITVAIWPSEMGGPQIVRESIAHCCYLCFSVGAGLFGRVCMCDCACRVCRSVYPYLLAPVYICVCVHIIYMPTCLYVDVRPRLYIVCRPMCV